MRRLLKLFVLLLLLVLAATAAAIVLSFEDRPLVASAAPLTPAQVQRASALLRAHDPRRLENGQTGRVTVQQDDIALAAEHLLGRIGAAGATVRVDDGALALQGTVELPPNPLGRYANLAAVVVQGDPLPRFQSLQIGRVPVPRWLANQLLDRAMARLYADRDVREASQIIREVSFSPGRVQVAYRWQGDTVERLRARLVPEADRQRLRAYNDALVRAARDLGPGAGLDRLLVPLLRHAAGRGGDAVAENRAALMVLEAYVNGRDLGALVPAAREWPAARRLRPTIQGRKDFAQHFMTSAVLAALGGSALSDAVGLYKEIDDSRGGSGFSFTDLAADRAGTLFGARSVRSATDATAIQEAAARGLSNDDLMPAALDLPEHMNEAEFARRYGGTGDPRYAEVVREIERRLSALELYRS